MAKCTTYDVPAVLSAQLRRDELRAKEAQLAADELAADNATPRGYTIADEAARLLREEPAPAPKANIAHERAVVKAAAELAERELTLAIIEASRLECEERRAEHNELLGAIADALGGVKTVLANEQAFRNELRDGGFSDTSLPGAFGSEAAALGRLLRGFSLESFTRRLRGLGVSV